MKSLHIAVCGAGPAGLATALALSHHGHNITLFDQFDEPQPVGSGLILQPAGLAVLDRLGVGERIRGLGARIDRLFGREARTGRIVLDVPYAARGPGRGVAVHRAALLNVLWDAVVATDVKIAKSSKIIGLNGKLLVLNEREDQGPYDLVVDGLGARSPLIPYASGPDWRKPLSYGAIWTTVPWPGGFAEHALEQRYSKASVMAGVLPLGSLREGGNPQTAFFWSLRNDAYVTWRASGLEQWKSHVRSLWPETDKILAMITSASQMVMASYDHHTLQLPFGPSLVFVGDSAHSTSPQLGQGANMALLDAMALDQALARAHTLDGAFRAYAASRRWHVKLYQAMSQMFTPFYQSDSHLLPLVRDIVVAPVARQPMAQRVLARIVAGSAIQPICGVKP